MFSLSLCFLAPAGVAHFFCCHHCHCHCRRRTNPNKQWLSDERASKHIARRIQNLHEQGTRGTEGKVNKRGIALNSSSIP